MQQTHLTKPLTPSFNLGQILEHLTEALEAVENAILHDIQTDIPLMTNVSEHILGAGGKRLRPVMVLLGGQIFDYFDEDLVRAAQVVEYLHTATLLHDDVVDNADTRRTQKAARSIWGNEPSILVGDHLFAMAFHMLTQLRNQEILRLMSQTTTWMAKGELLQLTRSYDTTDEKEYLEIIFNKTACLFAAAISMGAILGGASDKEKNNLYRYGESIGMAFQVVDDALDYMENQVKTGKSIGIDLQERKITLPLSHLLKNSSPVDHQYLKDILSQPVITQHHVYEVIQLMERYGSISYSLDIAKHYADQAHSSLVSFSPSPTKQTLEDLANFIVYRNM